MKTSYIILILCISSKIWGQSITEGTISSAFIYKSTTAAKLTSSIGESGAITFVTSSGKILSQGFLQVDDFNSNVSILVVENESKISVYPNPTSEKATLSFYNFKNQSIAIELYSSDGKRVLNTEHKILNSYQDNCVLDVSSLSAGTYIGTITLSNNSTQLIKIYKK